jgi:nucleoid-associated protein YgaU
LEDELRNLKQDQAELVEKLEALSSVVADKENKLAQLRKLDAELPGPPTPSQGGRVETIHTVQKGDTLIGISRDRYGDGRHWRKLLEYNAGILGGSELLQPGMKIRLPDLETLERKTVDGS